MVNIVLRHTFSGFIHNFSHLVAESLPVVHHYARLHTLLASPEKIQFFCDSKFPDVLSLYSSHPVKTLAERPYNAIMLSEKSRYLGILPLPSSWYSPTKSGRRTLHYKEAKFLSQQAISRFEIPTANPFILLIKRVGLRELQCEGLVERLSKIAPVREVVLEQLSFREQVTLASQSRCIVGSHGAGLSHLFFMRGGGVVEISPSRYVIDYFENQAQLVGLQYHCIEGMNPLRTDKTNLRDIETRKKLRDVPVIQCDARAIADKVAQIYSRVENRPQ